MIDITVRSDHRIYYRRPFSGRIPCIFPVNWEHALCRPVWRDCVRHQEVARNWRNFQASGIARHFRRLAPVISVCGRQSGVSGGLRRPIGPKVSGRKFAFPGMLMLASIAVKRAAHRCSLRLETRWRSKTQRRFSVTLAKGDSTCDRSSCCGREGDLPMQFALKDVLAL